MCKYFNMDIDFIMNKLQYWESQLQRASSNEDKWELYGAKYNNFRTYNPRTANRQQRENYATWQRRPRRMRNGY